MKNRRLLLNLSFISILSVLYIIYVAVLSPVSVNIQTDIIYSEGYLPILIDIIFELFQMLIWCHLFSFIIGSVSLYKAKGTTFIFISAAVATLIRYIIAPIIDVTLSNNALSTTEFIDALFYFVLDFAQITAALLIANVTLKNPSQKALSKASFRAFS